MSMSDWSSDVCSSDLMVPSAAAEGPLLVGTPESDGEQHLARHPPGFEQGVCLTRLIQREYGSDNGFDATIGDHRPGGRAGVSHDRCFVLLPAPAQRRSASRRVGTECFSTCSSR